MTIFGDSYTSGEDNNNISFADYLGAFKCGISGTCLDNYSIYPVEGGLLSQPLQIMLSPDETVLLEYGINDAASLVTGYVGIETIKVSIAKVYDLAKDAYFLMLTHSWGDLVYFGTKYAEYLNNEYLKGLYEISAYDYLERYLRFSELMQRKFKTLYMLPDGFREYDGIHPTDKGHRIIAEHLREQLMK